MTQNTIDGHEEVNKVIDELKQRGVIAKNLVIFHVGSDQIMAELHEDDDFNHINEKLKKNGFICIHNPKRILRLQQVQGNGVILSYMMGDFDLVEQGQINIAPTCWYRVVSQSPKTVLAILNLYKEYLDRKVHLKAEDAGLILPERRVTSPFKR
jgi:hypothetical protein